MIEHQDNPIYSPSPWARGMLYALCGIGALIYGHWSGERTLTPVKWVALGALAIGAGIALALLQNWARNRERG